MTKEELAEIKQWWGLHNSHEAGEEEESFISGDFDVLRAIYDFVTRAQADIPKLLGEVERLQDTLSVKEDILAQAVGLLRKNQTALKAFGFDLNHVIEAWRKELRDGAATSE